MRSVCAASLHYGHKFDLLTHTLTPVHPPSACMKLIVKKKKNGNPIFFYRKTFYN